MTKKYLHLHKGYLTTACLIAGLFLGGALSVNATEINTGTPSLQKTSLQKKLIELDKKVNKLELRIRHLESSRRIKQNSSITEPDKTADLQPDKPEMLKPIYQTKENWASLNRHLSEKEVFTLLGKPSSKIKLGTRMMWYYQYIGVGSGSVIFSQDKSLISWQEPSF